MDSKDLRQAKEVFDTLCGLLDKHKFKYRMNEEALSIAATFHGDDIPMDIGIKVDSERKLISLISPLPFEVPQDKRAQLALAISVINYDLVDGSFDYNFFNGKVLFRMTSSFRDSLIGEELFMYMLAISTGTVDDYNDKLFMVCKHDMELKDIIALIKGGDDDNK